MANNYAQNIRYAKRNALMKHVRQTTNLTLKEIGYFFSGTDYVVSPSAVSQVIANPNSTITRVGGLLIPCNILPQREIQHVETLDEETTNVRRFHAI